MSDNERIGKVPVPEGRPPTAASLQEDVSPDDSHKSTAGLVTERGILEEVIRFALEDFTSTTGYPVRAVHVLYTSDSDRADAAFRYDVEVRLGFHNGD